jgi:hypothetical protein
VTFDHFCGQSTRCGTCLRERSVGVHVCERSFYCGRCRHEASMLDHQCGETAFCESCDRDKPLDHSHIDDE